MCSASQEDMNFGTMCLWVPPSCTKVPRATATFLVSLILKDTLSQRLTGSSEKWCFGFWNRVLLFGLGFEKRNLLNFHNAIRLSWGFWIDTEFWNQLCKKTTQGYFESAGDGEWRVASWHISHRGNITSRDFSRRWLKLVVGCIPAILALRKQRQEDHAFSQPYLQRTISKRKQTKNRTVELYTTNSISSRNPSEQWAWETAQ